MSEDQIQGAITELACEDLGRALALVTGLFVGLVEVSVKQSGGDEKQEVRIDSDGKRDITIHARQKP